MSLSTRYKSINILIIVEYQCFTLCISIYQTRKKINCYLPSFILLISHRFQQQQQQLRQMQSQSKPTLAQMLKDQSAHLRLKSSPNIYIKILNQTHAQQIIDLLTHCFSEYQPLTIAYCKLNPEGRQTDVPHWRFFWDSFSQYYLTNGYSVGLFDSDNEDKLIGVSIAKDLNDTPDRCLAVAQRSRMLEGVLELEYDMKRKIRGDYQSAVSQRGVVMDIVGVALHQDYMGKRLLYQMMISNEALGLQYGYKYAYCYCTNFKTTKALEKIDYVKVSDVNAKQFQLYGNKYFQHLNPEQPYASLWMKPLAAYPAESIL